MMVSAPTTTNAQPPLAVTRPVYHAHLAALLNLIPDQNTAVGLRWLFGLNLNLIALVGVRIRLRLEDKQLTSRILPLPGAWMPRMPSVYVCLYRL